MVSVHVMHEMTAAETKVDAGMQTQEAALHVAPAVRQRGGLTMVTNICFIAVDA